MGESGAGSSDVEAGAGVPAVGSGRRVHGSVAGRSWERRKNSLCPLCSPSRIVIRTVRVFTRSVKESSSTRTRVPTGTITRVELMLSKFADHVGQ